MKINNYAYLLLLLSFSPAHGMEFEQMTDVDVAESGLEILSDVENFTVKLGEDFFRQEETTSNITHCNELNLKQHYLEELTEAENNVFYVHRPYASEQHNFSALLFDALHLQRCLTTEKNKDKFIARVIQEEHYPKDDFDDFHERVGKFCYSLNLDSDNPYNFPYKIDALAQKILVKNLYHINTEHITSVENKFFFNAFKKNLFRPYSCIHFLCRYKSHAFLVTIVNFSIDAYNPLMFIIDPHGNLLEQNKYYHQIQALYTFFCKNNPIDTAHNKWKHYRHQTWQPTALSADFKKIKDIKYNTSGTKIVVIGERKNYAQVWDMINKKPVCKLIGHQNNILCVAFHPVDDIILTGSKDGSAKLWNAENGTCLATLKPKQEFNYKIPITKVTFSHGNDHILTGLGENGSTLWVKKKEEWHAKSAFYLPPEEGESHTHNHCFKDRFALILIGTTKGMFHGYITEHETKIWKELPAFRYDKPIQEIYITPDSNYVIVKFESNKEMPNLACFKVICTESRLELVAQDIRLNEKLFNQLKHSHLADFTKHGGKLLFISHSDAFEIRLSQSRNKKPYCIIPHDEKGKIANAIYNTAGNYLLMSLYNGLIEIWKFNKKNWKLYKRIIDIDATQSQGAVKFALFNPAYDGVFITANLEDNTITLWQPSLAEGADRDAKSKKRKQLIQKTKKSKKARASSHSKSTTLALDALTTMLIGKTQTIEKIKQCISQMSKNMINSRGEKGFTALGMVAAHCNTEMIIYLIVRGADVNAESKNKLTPLHLAAAAGNFENVKCLLQHNADPNRKTIQGKIALDFAVQLGHHEIASYLKDLTEVEI